MNAQAEIPEANARGSVGDIYADIRATLRVPMVNTVYRHLATLPPALEWAWSSIRPHMVSGAIARQADILRQDVQDVLDAGGPVMRPGHRVLAAGLAQCAKETVRAYDTANRLNLVALAHLLHPVASAAGPHGLSVSHEAEARAKPLHRTPTTPAALLHIPESDALAPEVWARVQRLNRYGELAEPESEPQVVAGLYRQLAMWPPALEAAETWLHPWEQRGLLRRAREAAAMSVARQASLHPLQMAAPNAEIASRFGNPLRLYCLTVIPKMVPIGLLLADCLNRARKVAS